MYMTDTTPIIPPLRKTNYRLLPFFMFFPNTILILTNIPLYSTSFCMGWIFARYICRVIFWKIRIYSIFLLCDETGGTLAPISGIEIALLYIIYFISVPLIYTREESHNRRFEMSEFDRTFTGWGRMRFTLQIINNSIPEIGSWGEHNSGTHWAKWNMPTGKNVFIKFHFIGLRGSQQAISSGQWRRGQFKCWPRLTKKVAIKQKICSQEDNGVGWALLGATRWSPFTIDSYPHLDYLFLRLGLDYKIHSSGPIFLNRRPLVYANVAALLGTL